MWQGGWAFSFYQLYQSFQFTDRSVVGGCAGAVKPPHLVSAVPSLEAGVGLALIPIVVNSPEGNRLGCVFKVLASLLVAAELLITLPLQVPLQDLLKQKHVSPFGPQEHILCAWSPKHFSLDEDLKEDAQEDKKQNRHSTTSRHDADRHDTDFTVSTHTHTHTFDNTLTHTYVTH